MQKIIFRSLIIWLFASTSFAASSLSPSFVSVSSSVTVPILASPRTCSVILKLNRSTNNYSIEDDTGNSFRALVQSIKIEQEGSSGRPNGSQIVFKMHPLNCVEMAIVQHVNLIKEQVIDRSDKEK